MNLCLLAYTRAGVYPIDGLHRFVWRSGLPIVFIVARLIPDYVILNFSAARRRSASSQRKTGGLEQSREIMIVNGRWRQRGSGEERDGRVRDADRRIFDAWNFHLPVTWEQIVHAKSMPRLECLDSDEFIKIRSEFRFYFGEPCFFHCDAVSFRGVKQRALKFGWTNFLAIKNPYFQSDLTRSIFLT